jgi:hypothetical protein
MGNILSDLVPRSFGLNVQCQIVDREAERVNKSGNRVY